jgi:hypothetical protein
VRPRGRIGHYTTLLERILKKTADETEAAALCDVLETLRSVLNECNMQSGQTSNRLKIAEFERELETTSEQLYVRFILFRSELMSQELDLSNSQRQIIRANDIIVKKAAGETPLHLVLFDSCLVFVTRRKNGKRRIHKTVLFY